MAESKNNRKKGKKKNKNHAAPRTDDRSNEVQQIKDWKEKQIIDFIALGVMLLGYVIAMVGGRASLIGYPIAFLGALVCMVRTPWDTTNHKLTKSVLCVFCILTAAQFIQLMQGRLS